MENAYRLRIKMIDRIKRQFDILQSQKKRLLKLSESFSPANPLAFQSFMATAKSISTLTQHLSESFLDLLTPAQLTPILQTHSELIACLRDHLSQFYQHSQKLKNHKQQEVMTNTTKNMNCSTCGENIHESNIKQAKIYLEEETKQQFNLVMEQFKKIADEPIFTKEENNQYQMKLHAQLEHREKVLNINCNRIEEFVEIMDTTLADLKKIQEIELGPQQVSNAGDFATAFRIGEDVSNILQQSFSRKIPPWIHKMFVKMMTWYIQENSQKQKQHGVQANFEFESEEKQIKQAIREKRALQKDNKDITDELNQIKIRYKKLEEINNEYATMLVSIPRNIKIKLPPTIKQPKSRRNSKNPTKMIIKQDSTSRGQTPDEIDDKLINYGILNDEENSSSGFKNTKRKKNNIVVLPKIKKIVKQEELSTAKDIKQYKKEEALMSSKNLEKTTDKKSPLNSKASIEQHPEGSKHKQVQQTQITNKTKKKAVKNTMRRMEQKDHIAKDISRDKGNSQNQQEIPSTQNGKIKTEAKKSTKKSMHNRSNSLAEENEVTDRLKEITNTEITSKKSKTTKIAKLVNNNMKIGELNRNNAQDKKPDDDSTRQLYEYVANIKLNKKLKSTHPHSNTQPISQQEDVLEQTSNFKIVLSQSHTNNENAHLSVAEYNSAHNKEELMIMRKISKDLSQYINNKRISLFSSLGLNENQITNRSKISAMKSQEESQAQNKNSAHQKYDEQQQQQKQQEYEYQCDNQQQYEINIDNQQTDHKHIRNSDPSMIERSSLHDNRKMRSSENINQVRNSLDPSPYFKAELNRSQLKTKSLIELKNSQEVQKLLFDALKENQFIQNSAEYAKFQTLISNLNLTTETSNKQTEIKLNQEKPKQAMSPRRERSQNNSINQDLRNSGVKSEQGMEDIAHNSLYGRLFVNKAVAYKYEKSMAKSYHKKIMKQLDQHERDFCYQIYSQLCDVRKMGREYYNQFCSILRYPYQTLYTHFEVVNFVTEMSYDTFEYYFKKIAWIHRKCDKDRMSGLCHHLQSLRQQIATVVQPNTNNS